MARKPPDIYTGNIVKKRDRLSFKEFVIDIVGDTFINEFTPTSSSLDGNLFTIILGPTGSIEGYRFVYELLPVDDVKDYVDIYLYGVRQPNTRYEIELYDSGSNGPLANTVAGTHEIRFVFNESVVLVPEDVDVSAWDIKGKIKEIK